MLGVYAHIANRNWESDLDLLYSKCEPSTIEDIAQQLINGDVGSKLRVIMGGGRREFRDRGVKDEEGVYGRRRDGKDLIKQWLQNNNNGSSKKSYVWNLVIGFKVMLLISLLIMSKYFLFKGRFTKYKYLRH